MAATSTATSDGKCGAKTRSGGECRKAAGYGTDHLGFGRCKFHGGATPNGRKSAQRQQAETAVATYGLPRELNPMDALVEELHRTAGHVAWLNLKLQEFEEDDQLHGPVGGGEMSIPREEPHVWLRLYQAERTHFTRVAKTCIECGIAERQISLAEEQGQLLATVIRGVLEDLGVADNPEVPAVVRRHLTLVRDAA